MEHKQKRLPVLARTTSTAAAVTLCVVLTGCYGMYEGKAEKNLKTAEQWNADKFQESQTVFKEAQTGFQTARQAEDKDAMKRVAEQSEQAMELAKTRFADQQLKAAEASMKVAQINDANRGDTANLYTDTDAILTEARDQYNNQKYEDSIESSNEVIAKVDQMLASVQNRAENDLAQLNNSVDALVKAEGETYTPEDVDRAREAVRQVTEKVEKDRDYKQASLLAGSALGEVQSATIEAKKKHSEDELLKLEDKIAEAIAEEAPVHVPDNLQKVQDRYEALLANYYEKQYDSVLAASGNLRPEVDELITMARIEATKDRIRRVEEGIARMRNQNVEQYLPGRIVAMETLLGQARSEFNNNNFEGAKLEANNALVEYERISSSFDALAEQQLKAASTVVGASKEAYERMKQVFGPNASPIDPRIESRYQVQASELGTRLNASIQTLSTAAQNRAAKEFRKAIEQSQQAAGTAENVANGTYNLVAENALLGIQDQISELERQGAREFASTSLNDVQQMVANTKSLLNSNRSREAAEQAARTRAAVENVKQELAQRAASEAAVIDRVIQRLEGGAGPSPAAGALNRLGAPQRQVPFGEYPGGSDLNNKEAMLQDSMDMAASLPADEPVQLAQTHAPGHPVNSTGWTGQPAVIQNRSMTDGTFMTSDRPNNVFLGTNAPTGAGIGHRAEPVVNTYEATGSYRSSSNLAYEGPTAPGPFAAVESLDAGTPIGLVPAAAAITGIERQINEILEDNQRVKDLETYEPQVIETARQKLDESSSALASQDYTRAVQLARDAQRAVLAADREAAKQASAADLQAAADRINIANAAGAVMFAPAQITEARRLYDQGKAFVDAGEYGEARKVAARAVIAAEDARSYNVDKARDNASLSVRYGGYKASHPALTEANRLSDIADDMMRSPETAAQGQEVAKQAVALSQVALDHARDYTYQERLDNIYKALNTALRAGANYFNVVEVKRLVAELAVARDQYCTRNFDAVELKLKDIEARLARVIETTPLVLEENLIETTEKLNALILAGAENWMAQQVDDVKSLMNRSVIDFRKHDYQSSYMNIKNAMALTDRIEDRLQEQVYFDAVTELFAQMDDVFHRFSPVIDHNPAFMKKLISTEWGQPRALDLSSRLNPNEFKDEINNIYMRAIHLKPPKSQEAIHTEVLIAIKHAKVASENFQKLYILDQVSMPDAHDIIDTAYNQIRKSKQLRGEVQVRLIEPQARMKVIRAEKIVNY